MAERQYIGARYVIKIYENSTDPSSAEWEQGNFEPLIMVTWMNGSYLSKKQVPASVGNPADNPTYWVQTGFYNGQIATLQAQIDTLNNTTIPAIVNDVTTLESNVNKKTLKMSERTFLFMGDSYDVSTGYMGNIASYIKCKNHTKRSANGAGFFKYNGIPGQPTYYEILTSISPLSDAEKETITDVCFCVAVGNDNPQTVSDLQTAMSQIDTLLRSEIVNLENIYLFPVGWCSMDGSLQSKINHNLAIYSHWAPTIGWQYVDCTRVMRTGYFLEPTDTYGYHPTVEGATYIAECVANAILNGSCSWQDTDGISFSFTADLSSLGANAILYNPSGTTMPIILYVSSNGDLRFGINTWPVIISHADIAAGTNVQCDILLSRTDNKMPIPVNLNVGYSIDVSIEGADAHAQIIQRTNNALKIRLFVTSSGVSDKDIALWPSSYTIQK